MGRKIYHVFIIIIWLFIMRLRHTLYVSKRLQIYYYPGHRIQSVIPAHNVCTSSTPWGVFQPVAIGAHTVLDKLQWLSHPTGYPFSTWVESGKVWIDALTKDARPRWDSNTRPSVYKARVRTTTPRLFHRSYVVYVRPRRLSGTDLAFANGGFIHIFPKGLSKS